MAIITANRRIKVIKIRTIRRITTPLIKCSLSRTTTSINNISTNNLANTNSLMLIATRINQIMSKNNQFSLALVKQIKQNMHQKNKLYSISRHKVTSSSKHKFLFNNSSSSSTISTNFNSSNGCNS
jgi:hypothetical protein